ALRLDRHHSSIVGSAAKSIHVFDTVEISHQIGNFQDKFEKSDRRKGQGRRPGIVDRGGERLRTRVKWWAPENKAEHPGGLRRRESPATRFGSQRTSARRRRMFIALSREILSRVSSSAHPRR